MQRILKDLTSQRTQSLLMFLFKDYLAMLGALLKIVKSEGERKGRIRQINALFKSLETAHYTRNQRSSMPKNEPCEPYHIPLANNLGSCEVLRHCQFYYIGYVGTQFSSDNCPQRTSQKMKELIKI